MSGHWVNVDKAIVDPNLLEQLDEATNAWFMAAARGECGWICPDCCMSDPKGMPTVCLCNPDMESCNKILARDHAEARKHKPEGDPPVT